MMHERIRIVRDLILLPWIFPDDESASNWISRMKRITKELGLPEQEYYRYYEGE